MKKRIHGIINAALALALIASMAVTLIPQNALSFYLAVSLEPPLFTDLPYIPLEDEATVEGGGEPVTLSSGGENATAPGSLQEAGLATSQIEGSLLAVQSIPLILDPLFNWEELLGADGAEDQGVISEDEYLLAYDRSEPLVLIRLKDEISETQLQEFLSVNEGRISGKVPGAEIYKVKATMASVDSLIQGLKESGITESVQRDNRYGHAAVGTAADVAGGQKPVPVPYSVLIRNSLTRQQASDSNVSTPNNTGADSATATASVAASSPAATATAESTNSAAPESTTSAPPSTTSTSATVATITETASATVAQYSDANAAGSEVVETAPVSSSSLSVDNSSGGSADASGSGSTTLQADTALQVVPVPVAQQADATLITEKSTVDAPQPAEETVVTAASSTGPLPQNTSPALAEDREIALTPAGSGEVAAEYYAVAGSVGMRFAATVAVDSELASISNGEKGFAFKLRDLPAGDGSLGTMPAAATAVVEGNAVRYSVAGAGFDLLLAPQADGLAAEMAIHRQPPGNTIEFNLPLYGLFGERQQNGSLLFIDVDTGRPVFEINALAASAGDGGSINVSFDLVEAEDGTRLALRFSEAADWQIISPATVIFKISSIADREAEVNADKLNAEFAEPGAAPLPPGYLASFSGGGGRLLFGAAGDGSSATDTEGLEVQRYGSYRLYRGAAGADLRFKPIAYGIEEEIVLYVPPQTNIFTLPLRPESLTLVQNGNVIDVIGEAGLKVATISADLMYDSRPAVRGGPASSDKLKLELVEIDGGVKQLVVTADQEWLNDPSRVYPVFIDPTVSTMFPFNNSTVPYSTPTFYWSSSGQADAAIEIAYDEGHEVINGNSLNIEYYLGVFSEDELGTATRYTLPATKALPEGRYYWRVWVKDSAGNWAQSGASLFYVNTTHVASYYGRMPAKLPAGTVVTVPITVKNRGTSVWNATGPDRYALSYNLSQPGSPYTLPLRTPLPYDLVPGQEVTLNAALRVPDLPDNTQLTVKWEMVHEGICWFSDRGEHTFDLSATVQKSWNAVYGPPDDVSYRFPTAAGPGSEIPLRVKVTNKGTTAWNASSGSNNMALYARFIDTSGRTATDTATANGAPDSEVAKDGSAEINMTVRVPAAPGAYRLQLDLRNASTNEFLSDYGVPTYDIPIIVGGYGILPGVTYARLSDNAALNLVSGNLLLKSTDYKSSGRGPPVEITRTLNTLSGTTGVFGRGWSSILDTRLKVDSISGSVQYFAPDGGIHTFVASPYPNDNVGGYQNYIHPRGLYLTLKKNSSGGTFKLVNQDETLTYNFKAPDTSSGFSYLDTVVDSNGNTVSFVYDDATGRRIEKIVEAGAAPPDDPSKSVVVSYGATGLVDYIRVPASSERGFAFWQYGYGQNNNLASALFDPATDPDTGVANATGLSVSLIYAYNASATSAGLTSIKTLFGQDSQEANTTLAYDSAGRLTNINDPRWPGQSIGAGIAYAYDAKTGLYRTITNAKGGSTTYILGSSLQAAKTVTSQDAPLFSESFFTGDLRNWSPPAVNVARGKTASASETWGAGFEASKVIDGSIREGQSPSDYWLLPNQKTGWVQVDLGTSHVITGIRFLTTHNSYMMDRATSKWHISISNDNTVWADVGRGVAVAAVPDPDGPLPWTEVKMGPVLARYVRFYVDGYHGWGGGLNELQVYGNPAGEQPSQSDWKIETDPAAGGTQLLNALRATVPVNTEKYIVSRDSYSDFVFESPVYMDSWKDVGLIFRQTNSKTDFINPAQVDEGFLGYYFFRASGFDSLSGQPAAVLYKYENGSFVELGKALINAPAIQGWYRLRVEAIGPDIRCYLNDVLVIETQDWSFSRGRVGFRAVNIGTGAPATANYYFGGNNGAINVYGKALTSFAYDYEGNITGESSALKHEVKEYDDEVHGFYPQLPEKRWGFRTEAENTMLYGDDYDGTDMIWAGEPSWTDYSLEAKVKFLYAGPTDAYWGAFGGSAGLVIRSSGDPDNGYYLSLNPSSTASGIYLWKMKDTATAYVLGQAAAGSEKPKIGEWEKIKIEVSGTVIKVYRNGAELFTANDSELTKGKVGLRVSTARALFDDVKITGSDGAVLKIDDFQAKGLAIKRTVTDRVSGLISGENLTYDDHNRPLTHTDENKKRTTLTRDANGNITTVADATGTVTTKSYDSYGNVISENVPVQPAFNYVPNPSFEMTTTDTNWSLVNRAGSTVSYDTTVAYHGSASLKLVHNGSDEWIAAASDLLPVKAGALYTVSAFVKSTGFTPTEHQSVYLRFWDNNQRTTNKGQNGAIIPAATSTSPYDWQRVSNTVTAPAGANYADVLIAIKASAASTVWVDGVQLNEGTVQPLFNYAMNAGLDAAINNVEPDRWAFAGESYTSGLVEGLLDRNKWAVSTSPWTIESGELSILNSSGETVLKSNDAYGYTDFSARIYMKQNTDVGLAFRIVDDSNMYLLRASGWDVDGSTKLMALLKKVGGQPWTYIETVSLAAAPAFNTWYTLRVVDDGASITGYLYLNDTTPAQTISYTDATVATGKVGFRVAYGGGTNEHHFDDVVVKDANATVVFSDSFNGDKGTKYLKQAHTAAGKLSSWRQDLSRNLITPNLTYALSARVQTSGSGSGGARLRIAWKDINGNPLTDEYSAPITGSAWSRHTMTAAAPANATTAMLYLEQYDFQGDVYFDDVRFERTTGEEGFSALSNGSFEVANSSNIAVGWYYDPKYWSRDSEIYKSGNGSLKVSTYKPLDGFAGQSVTVKPNTAYMLSGWIKTTAVQSGRGAGAVLHVQSGANHHATDPVTGDTDWNLQTLSFTTGPDVTSISVWVQQGYGGGSTGTSWFDGVQLVEKSPWETTYAYDGGYNYVIRKTDPLGAETAYEVNAVGKNTKETRYLRSAAGQLTELATDLSFDNAGRMIKTVYPPAQTGAVRGQASATYDKAGNKLSETDVTGATTTYTYDAGGRKTSEEEPAAQLFADDFSVASAAWTSSGQAQAQWDLQQDGSFRGTVSSAWSSDVIRSGNSDWSWYELEADVRLDSGKDAGLEFHSADQPNSNLYYFSFSPSIDKWTLTSMSNGSWGLPVEGAYVSDYGETCTLKVIARGPNIEIYLKKKTEAAYGPSLWSGNLAGHEKGKVGLRLVGNENGAAAAFDNVTVKEVGTATSSYDNAGFLAGEYNWRGDNTTAVAYTTDAFGRVTAKTEAGNTTVYTYDEVGSKLTESDPRGNTTRYVYDSLGVGATFDRLGNLTSTVRSRSSDYMDLANTVDARGGISVDKSNAAGIVSTTDERNYSVTNTYSAKGSLESRTDAVYSPYLFAYDVMGSPGYFTDPFGNQTRFARDSLGRLTIRTDPRGLSQLFTYDNLGRMTGLLDSRGQAQFVSDIASRTVSFTNAGELAPYVSYEYDQAGNLTKATYSGGGAVAYGQSSFGEIGSVKDAAAGFASYSYDMQGRLDEMSSSRFPEGTKLTLNYDQNGNITGRSNPDGTAEEFTYDKENRMASFSLKKGTLPLLGAAYEYDNNGNRTLAKSSLYDYFNSGMGGWSTASPTLWSVTAGELVASTTVETTLKSNDAYGYTDFSARIKMTQSTDVGLAFRVQDDNNMYLLRASGWDTEGSSKLMKLFRKQNGGWTPLKQVALAAAPALGTWYTLRVVADGANIYGYFNGALLLTHSESTYASGKVGFRVGIGGGANQHRFDDVAIVVKTAYSYDASDQLISVTAPDGATTSYTYDQNGNRTRAASTSGTTYNYTYDAANQLTAIKDASGNILQSLTYDKSGNTAFGEAIYSYDERNRLTEALFAPKGSAGYSYDAQGRLLLRKTKPLLFADDFASGSAAWSFSDASKWSTAADNGNTALKGDGTAAATLALRNTSQSDLTLTAKVKITASAQGITDYNAGLIVRSDGGAAGPDKNHYYFGIYPGQGLWKLYRAQGGAWSLLASGAQTFNLNQYYTLTARVETVTEGVATKAIIKLYADGALKTTYTDTSPISFTNVGLRARHATALFDDVRAEGLSGSAETKYLYNDLTGALLHETDAQGSITATYTADEDGSPVSLTKNGVTYFYHYNAHGDVVALTDSGGNIIATFTYDPWGVPQEYDSKGAPVTLGTFAGTPGGGLFFLFGGMLYDAALGLYLTRTRAYNPKTGRFLQRDILDERGRDGIYKGFPFGKDAIGTNLYAWCANNPVNRIDPSGEGWVGAWQYVDTGFYTIVALYGLYLFLTGQITLSDYIYYYSDNWNLVYVFTGRCWSYNPYAYWVDDSGSYWENRDIYGVDPNQPPPEWQWEPIVNARDLSDDQYYEYVDQYDNYGFVYDENGRKIRFRHRYLDEEEQLGLLGYAGLSTVNSFLKKQDPATHARTAIAWSKATLDAPHVDFYTYNPSPRW